MRKLFAVIGIVALGWFVAKKTTLVDTAKCYWAKIQKEDKTHDSTRDKIRHARAEIDKMDKEIDRMIRPMAEYLAAVGRLKKDIASTEASLGEQKEVLKILASDLGGAGESLVYGGKTFTVERVEAKLKSDFESYRRLETQLKSQRALLEAKQTSLKGVQEQMAKVTAKKREFEVRLAQLEADEETLQIAKLGSKLQIDQSLTTQVEAALEDIARQHGVDRAELELRMGRVVDDEIVVPTRPEPKMDPAEILRYLERDGK